MIRSLFILLLLPTLSYGHDHLPYEGSPDTFSGQQFTTRIFKKIGKFNLMFEAQQGTGYGDIKANLFKLGTYYKLKNRQKIGFFVSDETGNRHNNDWVKDLKKNEWVWKDTSDRHEQTIYLTYGKRFKPDFRTPLILELRGEFQSNTFNQHQMFVLRPGLAYFVLKKRNPLLSFHLATPIYSALNFGQTSPYKYGLYFGTLYHLTKVTKLGFNISTTIEKWTESEEIKERTSESYSVDQNLHVSKLELIFQI